MKPRKIANICNTKLLGITLDNTLTWKTHIDMRVKIEFSMVCD
jgi:hypothetical protein